MGATCVAALCVGFGWWAHAARGGTSPASFTFNGTLRDGNGPLVGLHEVQFTFQKAGLSCAAPAVMVTLSDVTGAFTAPVSLASCPDFFDGSDVTYDIQVDGQTAVTGQPMGSVPYAKYSDVAVHRAAGDTTSLAARTRATLTLYVRTDGNDATCNGRFNAAAAATENCALATVQRAVDLLPETGQHTAYIRIGAGTFYKSSGVDLATINRPFPVLVYGQGTGTTVLSGAAAAAPGIALTGDGIVFSGGAGGRVQELTLTRMGGPAITATRVARLDVNTVAMGFSTIGLLCEDALCVGAGSITVEDNTSMGISILGGALTLSNATVAASRNTYGLLVDRAAEFNAASSTVTLTANTSYGFWCAHASQCYLGETIANDNGSWAILVSQASRLYASRNLTLAGRFGMAVLANARMELATAQSPVVTFDGKGISGAIAVSVTQQSAFYTQGAAVYTVAFSSMTTGVTVDMQSHFDTAGTNAAASITAGVVNVATGSIYRRVGPWPVATSCTNSQCL